jgi:hypothetical protein
MIYRMGRSSWNNYDGSTDAAMELAALLALLGVMSNALFHNASFTTFNADTLVMLFLYAACSLRRQSDTETATAMPTAQDTASDDKRSTPPPRHAWSPAMRRLRASGNAPALGTKPSLT